MSKLQAPRTFDGTSLFLKFGLWRRRWM